ncbi:MAG: tetratricopeptide repeat protein [Planctomycetaceae bacterium]
MPRCDACRIEAEYPEGFVRCGGRGWTLRQWCPPCADRYLTGLWGLALTISGSLLLAGALISRESGNTWWLRGLLVLGGVLPAGLVAAAVHVLGHFVVARLTGCEVQRVQIGQWGGRLGRWWFGEMAVEVRTIPLRTSWEVFPRGDRGLAMRMALVWMGGGLANLTLAVFAGIVAWNSTGGGLQSLWGALWLVNLVAAAGLIPMHWRYAHRAVWESDGRRLVKDWHRSEADWGEQRLTQNWLAADAALEQRDIRVAEKRFREGMQQVPDDPRGTVGLAMVALRAGRWMEARALFQEAAGRNRLEDRREPGNGWLLPFVDLLLARPELKGEAERLSAAEYARAPWWPEVQAVRGASLVWSGQTAHGLELLRRAEEGASGDRRVIPLVLQAMSRWFAGDLEEARRALARAQRVDPQNELLPRVAYQLGEPSPALPLAGAVTGDDSLS